MNFEKIGFTKISFLLWFMIYSTFVMLSQLDRMHPVFISLVIFPIVIYLVIIIYMEKNNTTLEKKEFQLLWIFAIVSRLVTLFIPVGLSDDIYRYVWDGDVQKAGYNPYTYTPNSENLTDVREGWWDMINHRDIHTPYPPIAQLLFLGFAMFNLSIGQTIILVRVTMMIFDLATMYVVSKMIEILRLPSRRVVYYALNPLIIIEFTGNGHIDIIAMFFSLLTIYFLLQQNSNRLYLSPLFLGIAVLVKFFPGVLIIFVLKRWRLKEWVIFVLSIIIPTALYMEKDINPLYSDGLEFFVMYFRFNSSIFRGLEYYLSARHVNYVEMSRSIYVAVMFIIAIILLLKYNQKDDFALIRLYTYFLFFALLLGPDVQPWYVLWLIPTSVLILEKAIVLLSCLVAYSYEIYLRYDRNGDFNENYWVLAIQYIPVYLILIFQVTKSKFQIDSGVDFGKS